MFKTGKSISVVKKISGVFRPYVPIRIFLSLFFLSTTLNATNADFDKINDHTYNCLNISTSGALVIISDTEVHNLIRTRRLVSVPDFSLKLNK